MIEKTLPHFADNEPDEPGSLYYPLAEQRGGGLNARHTAQQAEGGFTPIPFAISNSGAVTTVPGEPYTCYSWDDTSETVMRFNGKSWVVEQKDLRSGRIERFTQSGTSALGRVDVIESKGIPNDAPVPNAISPDRKLFSWEGIEDKGPARRASRNPVALPRTMRRDIAGIIMASPAPMGQAFENLLPPSVRREMHQETEAFVERLNGTAPVRRTPARGHSTVFAPH